MTAISAETPAAATAPVPSLDHYGPRPSKSTVRGVVLGVMAVMAIVSLTFALKTVDYRRARDPRLPQATQPDAVIQALPPAEWPALGWLPPDTGVVLGLHVAAAQQGPVSGEVLRKLRVGANPVGAAELENWTGLQFEEIDHAALGFKVEQRLIPPFVLVVQTRRPFDLAKVRSTLKAERSSEVGKKTVYHFTPRGSKLSFDVMLWPAAANTLIVCMTRADLESIPAAPRAGADHLPTTLQSLLKERVDAGAQFWLVGHVAQWDSLGTLLSTFLTKDALLTLAKVRSFAFSVQIDPGAKLRGAVAASDAAALDQLAQQWAELKLPEGNVPKEFAPVFQELSASYRCEVRDGWLTLDAQVKPETIKQAVQK